MSFQQTRRECQHIVVIPLYRICNEILIVIYRVTKALAFMILERSLGIKK
jgi:hypothetical protein